MQMDFKRLLLMFIFAFATISLWQNWTVYNAPKQTVATTPAQVVGSGGAVPEAVSSGVVTTNSANLATGVVTNPANTYGSAAKAIIKTDTMVATVSAQGGDIIRVELVKHKDGEDQTKNFVVLQDEGKHFYVANSGLVGANLPNHNTLFDLKAGEYVLAEGQDKLEIRMKAPSIDGISVTKILRFERDSYLINVGYEIENTSSSNLATNAYFKLVRDQDSGEQSGGIFSAGSAYTGPAVYTDKDKFQKIDFESISKDNKDLQGQPKYLFSDVKDGWVSMVQHYFVSAYLPAPNSVCSFFTQIVSNSRMAIGVTTPVAVAAGSKGMVDMPLYVGPQEQKKLEAIAPGFNLVVDYGWVTIIAIPLFWLLSTIHGFLGNWGWSILLVTLLIKLAFYPLSAASYKSMAKMKVLMPRMKQLQERFKDDKMKLNQAMMEMYKTEKVNPMGGCLPVLVQMPVFMALYYVLLSVVEMRHAPWLGWIVDLSAKDPYFILPIIMGVTMLIQTKLNPAPADPIQAKVMMLMPIMFTFMFLWFPSGLVLYWVLNNVLSIAQQWQITRMIESGNAKSSK
jgi:YidC/Oxa1 family membrane protein insertase